MDDSVFVGLLDGNSASTQTGREILALHQFHHQRHHSGLPRR